MTKINDAHYQIFREGNLLRVVLHGNWSLSADYQYLKDLSDNINKMHGQDWGILVDMRNWVLKNTPDNIFEQNVANVHLDRQGQVCECWIANSYDQASELQPFVESIPNLRFKRVLSEADAATFLKHFSLHL